ncbi:glycosyltransferase family 4 protein [Shewanella sp. 10N.286.54.B9]|uniref:glycosyltransferase family 4 protein n=1 Tax=Shewanella sp. 10N.286.54.B9 TaxID=3229719 RepID=UPI00354BD8C9
MSKKVLFISNHAGFSKFNAPYMEALHKAGYIVHNASPGIETGYHDKQYDMPISRSPISFGNLVSWFKLIKVAREEKYDLIHCHTPVGGVIGRLLKPFTSKTKVIYTAHGFHFFRGSSIFMWVAYFPIEYILSYITDCLVTINEEDYQFANKQLKCDSVFKINGVGVNLDRFRPVESVRKNYRSKLNFNNDDFVLVYAAQFISRKNHRFLLDCVANFKGTDKLKLLLVGDGPLLNDIRSLCTELRVNERVHFAGYVTNIEDYYSCADALVSCSNQEGFGLNLVEGLAAGLPYLASDVRGHRDIHNQTPSNLLFKLGDADDFDSKLELLINTSSSINKPVESCMLDARKFKVSYSVDMMMSIYSRFLR